MTLPDAVQQGVERALERHGFGRRIEATWPVSGGCINNGARIATDSGATLFLKWNPGAPSGLFRAESSGLSALRGTNALRVPEPMAFSPDAASPWLLMEYVKPGPADRDVHAALGRGLARLHRSSPVGTFGWEHDNWIGSLDQANTPSTEWADFWRDHRIEPQLALARRHGRARLAVFDDLLEVIPSALADVQAPSLVHGDLWGGNWFASESGEPVLIDPAVYRGHGEVDLAMSELFGGFDPAFYSAYEEAHGISGAYRAYRRELYQLYYLLVHVNLFGGSYEASAARSARHVLSVLR